MFGRLSHAGHSQQGQHPLRRRAVVTIVVAALLAALALLLLPPRADGNFGYWTSGGLNSSISRAKINGAGANSNFIARLNDVRGVAVDSKFI